MNVVSLHFCVLVQSKQMKLFQLSSGGLFLFIVVSFWSHGELQAMTQLDKERIDLGIKAAKSAAKALKAMEFVSWAAKIGKVAGPILAAVSIVLDIVMIFIDIPSPEMILMKAEFKNLNQRLDGFSEQFQEVRKKIDWSTVQISYEKHESTVHVLNQAVKSISEAQDIKSRDERIADFLRKFEFDFQMALEELYLAMTTESILSDNIFEATRKYTDQHPELSFRFMQGCAQLLLQAISIQGTYIHLKYNNTAADEYFKTLSNTKMAGVAESSKKYYYLMKRNWHDQMKLDVNRIALQNRGISHTEMSSYLFNYFNAKYIDRIWFAMVYNDIWTYERHSVYVCGGSINFRLAGRNFVVASQDKNFAYRHSGFSTTWAKNVLNSFGQFRQDHNGADGVLKRVESHQKQKCQPAAAIVVVGHGNAGFYTSTYARVVQQQKSVKWCQTELCWVWRVRYYATIVFG